MSTDNQLLLDFIAYTNESIFLTGKAGTGKTTLLRHIRDTTKKNFAVVAPTAVAAINAGGVTMHSFFQIPFGPLVPNVDDLENSEKIIKFSEDKIKILRCLELLIIDEVSMVRADTIDFIDFTLRNVKGVQSPFGGVQVLMIGDLYQLSPVAHDAWHVLRAYYTSPYFFDSLILRKATLTTFLLEKVYRQSDPLFLDILNGIRENNISETLLAKLNARYDPSLNEVWKDEYIALTTHNHLVSQINTDCLIKLQGDLQVFKARIVGEFPKEAYPTDEILELKLGAQVMFIKNDPSAKKQYYNGKAAKIISLDVDSITVNFIDGSGEIEVKQEEWQNIKYDLNKDDKKLNEINMGSFFQYPFKLAWAITVHKSQGLTFDRAIVDVSSSFAHGQAYVALSRCRSLEGLILKSPVTFENIIADARVVSFTKNAVAHKPDETLLKQHKNKHQWLLIKDLFDFSTIAKYWKLLSENNFSNKRENASFIEIKESIQAILESEILKVSARFRSKELTAERNSTSLANEQELLTRIKKAAAYFIPKIDAVVAEMEKMAFVNIYVDEKAETILQTMNDFLKDLAIKKDLLQMDWDKFSPEDFNDIYQSVSIKYVLLHQRKAKKIIEPQKEIENQKLHLELLKWRQSYGEKHKIAEHTILSEQTLLQISSKLPKSIEELASIKGVGLGNAKALGDSLLRLVNNYLGTSQLF